MKRKKLYGVLLITAAALFMTLGLTACGKKHTHAFTEQKTEAAYLKSAATCTEAAVYYKSCTCGEKGTETFTSGSALGHTDRYTYNNDNTHKHDCSVCDTVFEASVACTGGTATCTQKATCERCGTEYGNALGHTDRYTTNNDGTHKHDCSVCNAVLEASVACSGGTATCTEKAVCEVCHVQYGEVDANNHAGGVATCTQKAVCERCREEYGELDPNIHAYTGGICGDCGELQTKGLAYTPSSDGTYYTVSKGGCTDTEIHILAMYDGKPVTSIGYNAFYNCSNLRSIEIPSSVTSIGYDAFGYCAGLTSITIPSSVTSIGYNAFEDCYGLTSITIPSSVTSIGYGAFGYCSGLTSITVASGNTKYHSDGNCIIETQSRTLIAGCMTSVIPTDGSVTRIDYYAFYGCSGLTSIEIPNGVTSIGYYAFSGCYGLTSIEIPSSVTSIGYGAFKSCRGLTSITVASGNTKYHSDGNCIIKTQSRTLIAGCMTSVIPTDGSVTSIGSSAFYGCSGLTSIEIPNGVTSIGHDAFNNCSGLTSIEIPSSVTSIGDYAFHYCSGLTSITIPSSVTSIGDDAFFGCSRLTDVYYTGSEEDWAAISIGSSNAALTGATIHYNYVEESE